MIVLLLLFFCVGFINSENYTLVWSDEFDEPNLDLSKWDFELNCWGGGNSEKQCYVKDPTTLWIDDGLLRIHPVYYSDNYNGSMEGCTNNMEDSCTWSQPVTSARIRTLYSRSWKFGKFEFRAKLPVGDFLWPAIWMLPTDNVYGSWAASGEIDIVEFRSQEPNVLWNTLHHGGAWPNNTHTGTGPVPYSKNFTEDFHVFTLEWTPEYMSWLVDDEEIYELSLNRSWYSGKGPDPYTGPLQPFDQDFHIIMNLAIAGNFFLPEYPTFDPAIAHQTWKTDFIIDYVRVYQIQGPNNNPGFAYWPYVGAGVGVFVIIVGALIIIYISRRKPNNVNNDNYSIMMNDES